jgi:ATP-dependent exoDNAse (exonuclease V) beta subunit
MNHKDYLKLPGISASFLKACLKSAYDGYKYLHEPRDTTKAMEFGTAVHTFLLEPHLFASQYAISEKFDRRTKAGKEGFEAFQAANAGKIVLDEEDAVKLQRIVANAKAIPQIREALDTFYKEKTFEFSFVDQPFKARLDLVDPDGMIIIDVKTTKDASEAEFAKTMMTMHYDMQLAIYSQATGRKGNVRCYVIAIETDTCEVALYDVTDFINTTTVARKLAKALETAKEVQGLTMCPPKFPQGILKLEVPAWVEK